MKNLLEKIKKLAKLLNPSPKIGGLEISDSILRYVEYGRGRALKQASLRLPAGIIKNGQVVHKQNLIAALSQLRRQIGGREDLNIIVSISAVNVYTQIFNLPAVVKSKLSEAAELNLKMISPIDIQSAYYDWQLVGEDDVSGGRLDLIGVFVSADIIDGLAECFDEAGFVAVAIEPAPISLARAIDFSKQWDMIKPHLVFSISGDGLDFFILKNGNLYFNYFVPWSGGDSDLATVKKIVSAELKRILNFYTSRWGEVVKDLILVSVVANKELVSAIENEFELKARGLSLEKYGQLSPDWAVALGTSLRALIPRFKDVTVSLAKIGTEEKFSRNHLLSFINFWRNGVVAVLVVMLLAFGVFDFILARSLTGINEELAGLPVNFSKDEVMQLEGEAKEFNVLVEKAAAADEASEPWSPMFYLLRNLAGGEIVIEQIQIQQGLLSVTMSGSGDSERAVVAFKERVAKQNGIKDVILPLTDIKIDPLGRAEFTLRFKLEKWPL
ncbi:MAG: hypothetical protein ABH822_00310 [Patescibacteria group bacterium]